MKASRYFSFLFSAGLIFGSAQLFAALPPAGETEAPPSASDDTKLASPAPTEESAKTGELRDLTQAPSEPNRIEDPEDAVEVEKSEAPPEPAARPQKSKKPGRVRIVGSQSPRHSNNRQFVVVGGSAHSPADETAQSVIAVLGSAQAEGPVDEVVVAVLGNSSAKENVGEVVVAIFGNATAEKEVGDSVVAVFGSTFVNGHVHGQVVSVFGTIHLGPNAVVDGEVVSIGGQVIRNDQAVVHGGTSEVPLVVGRVFNAMGTWFPEAPLKGRLLTFRFGVSWLIAFGFLVFYALIALAFHRAITRTAETLEQRPGRTVLAAFLSLLITPALLLVLVFTVVGPFILFFALLIGVLIGKTAFLAWIGRRIVQPAGWAGTAISVLIGGLILMVAYALPYFGLLIWAVVTSLGFGMAVYTLILSLQRERPPVSVSPLSPSSAPNFGAPYVAPSTSTPMMAAPPVPPVGSGLPSIDPSAPMPPPFAAVPPPPIVPAQAYSALPRAGFWIRLAASLLDAILIAIAASLIRANGLFLFWLAVYCVVMWALKGTTVGGVICGLKVIRVDDRPLDWTVSIVRALAGVLSLCAAGLGFIWVAFDHEKQSWHDKVAGTTIVRVPKGVSLI